MTREMLYDAITEVRDELIVEAIETPPAKSKLRWLKFGSIAASFAVVVGLGAGVLSGKIPWLRIGGNTARGGADGSMVFDSYAGPVFPLTTVEGGDGLTVERAITYDFEGWMAGDFNRRYYGLPVTDSYTLTNPTGEDKTVTLLYPFAASLFNRSYLPTLTADGAELQATLLTGQYSQLAAGRSGGLPSLNSPDSWEKYRELLSDGRYQAGALGDWPDLSHIPVTVYEITNSWVEVGVGNRVDGNYNPNIHAELELNYDKTTALSYGFNSYCRDPDGGTARFGFNAPQPPAEGSSRDPSFYEKERAQPHYLIVIGEPLDSFRLVGVSTGAPESTDYLEWGVDIGADLRQYETDLDSALRTVAEQGYGATDWNHYGSMADAPDFKLYFGMMKDCLLDTGILLDDLEARYDFIWLEDLYPEVIQRVFYLEAEITIPAGASVTVEAQMLKEASFDHACTGSKNMGVYGYDLVTKLGTNLEFTAQTVKAVNTDGVEIVRQNFGFDWENEVDTVTLDPAAEHYYLEVRRIKTK